MRDRSWITRAALFFLLLMPICAQAEPIAFTASLDVAHAIPPTLPPGYNPTGFLTGVFDPESKLLSYTISWQGLSSNAYYAVIEYGYVTGPKIASLFGTQMPPTGSFTNTRSLSDEQVSALLSGFGENVLHVELGTIVNNAPGEIAGKLNVSQVPEPATALLLGTGLAWLASAASRRRESTSLADGD